ncbi:MAG: cytochrome c4 [Burkholderiales bacterium PBB5]|nr:MAG: cytochrome c4 [Burkholderiales bacterium PBB5]
MKSLLALSLSALISVSAFAAETKAPAKPDLAKGAEKATQVCAACHTADGSRGSPANPILQGQHTEYLVKQLTEFKAGKRANPIMSGMAAALTEDDMKNVAAFYNSKTAKPGFAKDKALVALGEKIYRGGIAEAQLVAFRSGARGNSAQMAAIAARMSDKEIKAVADYVAGLR